MSAPMNSTCRPLRILIVDDNHINLSVLSTLLKRRFSHLIDGAPASVDSGLKAIQLLRTHIFDCIFMDIQMPFLSGLEAARRIRNAEDGILSANSDAHIVAVTTAIGDEPELAYRRMRMDGMIGKPVRYNQLQQYLLPLAQEAHKAALTVPPLFIDGVDVMPPLPPASEYERVFYLPADAITPSTRPDICEGSDFERLLNSQTRASLRRFDITTPTCNDASVSAKLSPISHDLSNTLVEEEDCESTSTISSRCNSSSKLEKMEQTTTTPMSSPPSKFSRPASMMISRRTLSKQILREVANADLDSESGESSDKVLMRSTTSSLRSLPKRPRMAQRNSSPGWLSSDDSSISYSQSPTLKLKRPPLSALLWSQDHPSPNSSGGSSETSEDSLMYPGLRRVSEASSGSNTSDASSAVNTPACESPLSMWAAGASQAFGFARAHERTLSNRTASQLDSDEVNTKESWSASSETATANSTPARIKVTDTADDNAADASPYQRTLAHRQIGLRHFDSLQDLAQSVGQLNLTS